MGVYVDYDTSTGGATSLSLRDPTVDTWGGTTWGGGSWATDRGLLPDLRRVSSAGTTFSVRFSNQTLNTVWSISKVDLHMASQRIPSVIEA